MLEPKNYDDERLLSTQLLLAFHSVVFLLSAIRTIVVILREKTLCKLNQITHIICCAGILPTLNQVQYVPYIFEKYGELTILLSFLMILLFWINSLYEGDPIYKIIKHPKFFAGVVILSVSIETVCMVVDLYCAYNPNNTIITAEQNATLIRLYSSYRSIMLVLMCFGFSFVGYLIHRKAKRLSSRNVNRFRRTGLIIGMTFLTTSLLNVLFDIVDSSYPTDSRVPIIFLVLGSSCYGIMVLENLFFIFRFARHQESNLSKSTSHISLGSIRTIRKDGSAGELSISVNSQQQQQQQQQQVPTLTSSQSTVTRSFSSLSSVANISDSNLAHFKSEKTRKILDRAKGETNDE
ncbi:hypothetical protein DFA_00643 [Cavenderia fasciculata]|uniref:Uncharacterized protein n=1 Tax=Cavenderia fasciculata TaxID=261658 RepID=F4PSY9_CACFS|nr:uncharacterized protein DFA_00643 [Cavenderia fasciculata]EGG20778.1 hypothetical protein DFA_00643 [Cavenderia fasciculata]|eukprot:XP_004358628.1 hypothetical protein DFA_00643 [Cavenderia fasciculata]